MPSVLLYLIFIFGIFAITEQKNKHMKEIQKLLDFLSQKDLKNRAPEAQKFPYYSRHPNHKRRKNRSDENNSNLMNIQTLNLYYKHNNLKNKNLLEDDLKQAPRLENDGICKISGRCGCSGARCGRQSRAEDKTIYDIDQLLNDLNKHFNKKQDGRENQQDYDDSDTDLTLKADNNKLNDDLNIIFLEIPGSEERLLGNNLQGLKDDVKIVDLRNIDLGNFERSDRNDRSVKQTFENINPEDLAKYYEEGKKEITNSLLEYVKGKARNSYLSQLLPYQKKQIKLLKAKQLQIPIIDEDLKKQIINLIYGNYGNSKILPQSKDNNVYVPQRVFDEILRFKDKNLRRVKNLFPLTSQQKERLQKKNITSENIKKKLLPKIEHTWD